MMKTILNCIDSISEWAGNRVRWLCVLLVLLMVFEITMRYVFKTPTIWAFETAIMLGVTIYIFAFSYAHRYNAHIRIDVFYNHLPPRGRAIIDVVGSILFFFPVVIILIYTSIAWTWRAWIINERMMISIWYPPIAPLRTVQAV